MRIVVMLLAALLICSMFVTGYRIYPAPIEDINICAKVSLLPSWQQWHSLHNIENICANESLRSRLLPWYSLQVVSGEPSGCDKFSGYFMTRFGNRILVMVLNVRPQGVPCTAVYTYVDIIIPLGSCFIPGVTYTVVVNGVTETFVA